MNKVMLIILGSFDITNGGNSQLGHHEKSNDIAQKAAQEAMAASDAQNFAGQQAARQVKIQLAEKAIQAAKSAEAALSGKEAIVDQLQEEVKEARSVSHEESSSLQQVRRNANAAILAARQMQQQLKTLTRALQVGKTNLVNAEIAAAGARRSLTEKEELLDAAKRRVEELATQLRTAKADLENTNRAAIKAESAAQEANMNANRDRRRSSEKSLDKSCDGTSVSKKRAKTTNLAQNAAKQAKAASEAQNFAGAQAAHQVKKQLAEKATEAAKAAEAALAGKQAIVEQLQQEVKEAEAVVREETLSLQKSRATVNSAVLSAYQAEQGLQTLTKTVGIATENLGNAEATARGAVIAYTEKQRLVQAAKRRTEELMKEVECAENDLAKTKDAAIKADESAHEAKVNADRNKRSLDVGRQ